MKKKNPNKTIQQLPTICFLIIILMFFTLCSQVPPSGINITDVGDTDYPCNETVHLFYGNEHRLNCTLVSPSKPPPTISFEVGYVPAVLGSQVDVMSGDNSLLTTSYRVATLNLTQADSGKIISCWAHHQALDKPLQKDVVLKVGCE